MVESCERQHILSAMKRRTFLEVISASAAGLSKEEVRRTNSMHDDSPLKSFLAGLNQLIFFPVFAPKQRLPLLLCASEIRALV
jgi:hypothetical protein